MQKCRAFFIILLWTSSLFAKIPKDIRHELLVLKDDIAHLKKSQPGFFAQTVSKTLSNIITGVIIALGTKWLIDSFISAKNKNTKTVEEKFHQHQPISYSFKNLAGKIPKDVLEVTEFIKNTDKFARMGAKMPRGILLVGLPGTGKTSIARAIAGETEAYFIAISASEFIEMFVGNGPRRVRDLFAEARKAVASGHYKKAIIFIDELDSIGGARNAIFDAGGAEYRNTLNELLHQMDGFTIDDSIFVLGATNREQDIDPALKRAGRFDRTVEIELPDTESREAILRLYAHDIKLSKTIDFDALAQKTDGMSGADLKNLVNEAAIYAVRDNAKETQQKHFESVLKAKSLRFI